jgi:hypothetical protein
MGTNPASSHLPRAGLCDWSSLVEQSLTHIFPDGMRSIVSDGIELLHFDDAEAAHALDAEDFSFSYIACVAY